LPWAILVHLAGYEFGEAEIQREADFWNWDDDEDLIGLAKVAFLPFGQASGESIG